MEYGPGALFLRVLISLRTCSVVGMMSSCEGIICKELQVRFLEFGWVGGE